MAGKETIMQAADAALANGPKYQDIHTESGRSTWKWMRYGIYALAFVISISIWFPAIRAPLWQDETGSWWQISAGLSHIWARQGIAFPAYTYILWLSTKIIGTSEIALRVPSILAMLGAVYLFYRAARELFKRDGALIATIIFCLDPIVIFEAADVRPYAFAVLTVNAAILILLRLRHNDSNWLAALFGLMAAGILYFHYLFAAILPALVLCLFIVKFGVRRAMWRQFGVAFAAFALASLPLVPGVEALFRTSGTHVFEKEPTVWQLLFALAPGWLAFVFIGTAVVALVIAALKSKGAKAAEHFEKWHVWACASLGLIPLLILYGVSVATPLHMFTGRHLLVAVPGVALCWALLVEKYLKSTQLLFCVALVAVTAGFYYSHASVSMHSYSWKSALAIAEKNASADNAPVVICSDFPESDYVAMPVGSAKGSRYFAPLSYYKLSVPVVPMPRAMNAEAIRVGSQFLQQATQKHERFLALAYEASYPTLVWLVHSASPNFKARDLGTYDGIEIFEFTPAR